MIRMAARLCAVVALTGLSIVPAALSPAHAQVVIDKSLQGNDRKSRPAASANLSPLAAAPWPRLDAGSLVCRTRQDLDAHHQDVEARLNGQPQPVRSGVDCKMVGTMTPIDVVTRAAPSATEVRLRGESGTEWTDTWLPSRPPR